MESGLVETKENGMTEIPLNDANTMNEKLVDKHDHKSSRYKNNQHIERYKTNNMHVRTYTF